MNARIRRKRRRDSGNGGVTRNTILLIVAVCIGTFLVGYGVSVIAFTGGTAPSEVVMVPDVREMQLQDAVRTMDRSGLDVEVGDSFPNPTLPAGAVLAQSPLPGQEVSPGTEVRLIVSTGRPRPKVPDVSSMPLSLATRALQTAGFEVLIEEAEGEGPEGAIVEVVPEAGTPLLLPATVRLRVGTGAEIVEMPTLIGMLEEPALTMLTELGMDSVEVVYENSRFGEPGSVVFQEPAPGDSVYVRDWVRIRVTPASDAIPFTGPVEMSEPSESNGG